MQILPAALAAAAAIFQSLSTGQTIVRSNSVLVRAVVDGNTIDVVSVGRVRLLGIDAPKLGRGGNTAAPFATEARDRLTALVLHRWIRLEREGQALDAHSRRVAYVLTEDGVFINAVLVREGLARLSARVPPTHFVELQRAEADAQAYRRGMWGATPQVPSTGYTRPSGATHPDPAGRAKTSTTKKNKKSK
jgi:endonuclease YncB( thermonuclease family)